MPEYCPDLLREHFDSVKLGLASYLTGAIKDDENVYIKKNSVVAPEFLKIKDEVDIILANYRSTLQSTSSSNSSKDSSYSSRHSSSSNTSRRSRNSSSNSSSSKSRH